MLHLSHILLKITMILGVKFVVCICFSKKKKKKVHIANAVLI